MSLTSFLNAPANSVTRERMFFHRLYFDLKLAAARANYPLHIFEPDVDRDGFDIVVDDGSNSRRIQLKTVCISSQTSAWKIERRLMLPNLLYGEHLKLAPADCGLGGGAILLEIDDTSLEAPIRYYYTDYSLLLAFSMGLFVERTHQTPKAGRPPLTREKHSTSALRELRSTAKTATIERALFVKPKNTDCLLAIAGLHSVMPGVYLPMDRLMTVIEHGFRDAGSARSGQTVTKVAVATAAAYSKDMLNLLDEPSLVEFEA